MKSSRCYPTNQAAADRLKDQGNALLKQGKAAEATLAYTAAIKAAPYTAVLYGNRAAARLQCHQYCAALRDGQKCVALDPSYLKGYSRIAAALSALGRLGSAMDACASALRLIDEEDGGVKKAAADKHYFQMELAKLRAEAASKLAAVATTATATLSSEAGISNPTGTVEDAVVTVPPGGGRSRASTSSSMASTSDDSEGEGDAAARAGAAAARVVANAGQRPRRRGLLR